MRLIYFHILPSQLSPQVKAQIRLIYFLILPSLNFTPSQSTNPIHIFPSLIVAPGPKVFPKVRAGNWKWRMKNETTLQQMTNEKWKTTKWMIETLSKINKWKTNMSLMGKLKKGKLKSWTIQQWRNLLKFVESTISGMSVWQFFSYDAQAYIQSSCSWTLVLEVCLSSYVLVVF